MFYFCLSVCLFVCLSVFVGATYIWTLLSEIKELIDGLHDYADQSSRCDNKKGYENKYKLSSITIYPGIVFLER